MKYVKKGYPRREERVPAGEVWPRTPSHLNSMSEVSEESVKKATSVRETGWISAILGGWGRRLSLNRV